MNSSIKYPRNNQNWPLSNYTRWGPCTWNHFGHWRWLRWNGDSENPNESEDNWEADHVIKYWAKQLHRGYETPGALRCNYPSKCSFSDLADTGVEGTGWERCNDSQCHGNVKLLGEQDNVGYRASRYFRQVRCVVGPRMTFGETFWEICEQSNVNSNWSKQA